MPDREILNDIKRIVSDLTDGVSREELKTTIRSLKRLVNRLPQTGGSSKQTLALLTNDLSESLKSEIKLTEMQKTASGERLSDSFYRSLFILKKEFENVLGSLQ